MLSATIPDVFQPTPAVHNDASGNLILDDGPGGGRFYEYDAWGRLVKVSERGTLAFNTPLENEEPELEGAPGRWLVHYTYDALGRLIRKQTPVRDGTTNEQLAIRTERYFYDGARRIQEVATEPIIDIDPEPQGPGGPSGGLTLAEEMELLEGESEANIFVDREYVYVPSGASGYVDEFICQIDRYQDLWYILQDVNYNVIALTDSGGDVVRQHTFDPYGEILTAEDFDTHPGIKVGHQGLFFDRLEPSAPVGGLISMSAAVQLQPGIFGLYQARNRVLLPRYGRWAQKDPNASGLALLGTVSVSSPDPNLIALGTLLADSANVFSLVGGDPVNRTDPTGLSWRESLEGVLMPIVTVAGGQMGGAVGMLNELLNGYHLMISTHSMVQGAAYDAEDQIDWALDWNSSDFDNPRFGNLGPDPYNQPAPAPDGDGFVMGRRGGFPALARSNGVMAQRWGRTSNKAAHVKRYVYGIDAKGNEFKRLYDGVGKGKPGGLPDGHYVEVKHGNQRPTLRLLRQMDRDRILLRDKTIGGLKWEFYLKKGDVLNSDIQIELANRGIAFTIKYY